MGQALQIWSCNPLHGLCTVAGQASVWLLQEWVPFSAVADFVWCPDNLLDCSFVCRFFHPPPLPPFVWCVANERGGGGKAVPSPPARPLPPMLLLSLSYMGLPKSCTGNAFFSTNEIIVCSWNNLLSIRTVMKNCLYVLSCPW